MPNWCRTDFIVSGLAEGIARFREAVLGRDGDKEIPFDFNRLDPMPFELRDTVPDFGTAYTVYYGDAEPILEYAWVKKLEISTVPASHWSVWPGMSFTMPSTSVSGPGT